jgi:uncharacterized protein YkwD
MHREGRLKSIFSRVVRDATAALLLAFCAFAPTCGVEAQTIAPAGASGEHQDSDKCQGSSFLVGFVVRSGDWLNQIAIICSPVDANGKTGAPNFGPLRGGNGGSPPHNVTCQVNDVAVGVILHFMPDNRRVRGIGLDCKNAQDVQRQGLGRIVDLGHSDSAADSMFCNPGNVIVRVDIHWGADINGVGIACGPGPKIAPPTVTPAPPTSSSPSADQNLILSVQNNYRNSCGVPPLTWSPTLAQAAANWVKNCPQEVDPTSGRKFACHENDPNCPGYNANTPYGENLSFGSPSQAGDNAALHWICEWKNYNFQNPAFVGGSFVSSDQDPCPSVNGHFTQVVWKATTTVGCASNTCTINGQTGTLWSCKYSPPGNFNVVVSQNVTAATALASLRANVSASCPAPPPIPKSH